MESTRSAQIKSSELPLLVLSVAVQGLDDIFVCVCSSQHCSSLFMGEILMKTNLLFNTAMHANIF